MWARPFVLNLALEAVGLLALIWWWHHHGMGDRAARVRFVTTGRTSGRA